MTSNKPLVSVFVPTYNQEKYIEEALLSALEQDYDNLEVVVSDDASTDRTPDIIREIHERYQHRLKPIYGDINLGITGNCNRCLKHCNGKYIAFHAGDDVFLPGKIKAQVEWFENDSLRVLCGHEIEVIYQDGRPSHKYKRSLSSGVGPKRIIKNGGPYGGVSVMIRSSAIPPHGYDPLLPNVSDRMLWIECLIPSGEYGHIHGVYAKYRRHSNNVTNNTLENVSEINRMLEIVSSRYPDYSRDCRKGIGNMVHYSRGTYKMKCGDTVMAREDFLKAIKVSPLNYKIWIRLLTSFFK